VPVHTAHRLRASFAHGYDVTAHLHQFAQGIQIERLLVEYDQKNIIESRPRALALSICSCSWQFFDALRQPAQSLQHGHSSTITPKAWPCARTTHTTTTGRRGGPASTTWLPRLHATALAAAQLQMAGIVDMQAEPIEVVGDRSSGRSTY